jgi:hypothetical protein
MDIHSITEFNIIINIQLTVFPNSSALICLAARAFNSESVKGVSIHSVFIFFSICSLGSSILYFL